MSVSRPRPLPPEANPGWPNPYEQFPPSDAYDAFSDCMRFLAITSSRAEIIEFAQGLDSVRIIQGVQGIMVIRPPLSGRELMVGNVVEWCARRFNTTPVETIGALESVRQEILDGGIFVGQEQTSK